jgi:hypothetical protein
MHWRGGSDGIEFLHASITFRITRLPDSVEMIPAIQGETRIPPSPLGE